MGDKKIRITVITDRYPPGVVGGAERSLVHVVDNLKNDFDIFVIALTGGSSAPSKTEDNSIPVRFLSLPHVIDFDHFADRKKIRSSFEKRFRHIHLPRGGNVYNFTAAIVSGVRYLFKHTKVSWLAKLEMVLLNTYCAVRDRENIESLDEDYPALSDVPVLRDAIIKTEPDLILADNSRSILRVKEAGIECPAIAVVRDLKFFCPRRKRIAYAGKRPCDRCDSSYECVDEVPFFIRPLLKKVFDENRKYRLGRLLSYDRIVTTSRFMGDLLKDATGRDITVIPNPVEAVSEKDMRKRPGRDTVILHAGMLNRNKGSDIMIRVFGELAGRTENVKLVMAGHAGVLKKELEDLVAGYGIPLNVRFTGFLDWKDLESEYAKADVVVCPTRWPEPFGRVPVEAMGFGCIVIASDSGGFRETITDGVNGFLCKPMDKNAFVEKILYVMNNEEKMKSIRDNAMESVKKFAPGIIAAAYKDLFLGFHGENVTEWKD